MRPVKIITDSCADLGRDLREKYDIDYARMLTIYDGKEQLASLDFEYYTPKELYDLMREGNRVTTAQVPEKEFERIFGKYLKDGFDIIYIGCSLKQSSSVNLGKVVAQKLMKNDPGSNIYCIDSLNASMGEGMLAIRAAEYRNQGLDAARICQKILVERNTVNEYCTVHSLNALKRAGRVKASSAFFGNLLGVKPIIIADANGEQTPIKKVKGRGNSLNEIVWLLKDSIIDSENQRIYIAHADCAEEAEEVKKMIEEQIPCKEIYVDYIGPIIGASIGPDALSVFAFGEEVTYKA